MRQERTLGGDGVNLLSLLRELLRSATAGHEKDEDQRGCDTHSLHITPGGNPTPEARWLIPLGRFLPLDKPIASVGFFLLRRVVLTNQHP